MMATTRTPPRLRDHTFRATVTGRHTITLPAELRRRLGIAPGDAVEITVEGQQATLHKVTDQPTPELRGLLSDYFVDREDVQRFVDDERSGWEE